MNDNDKTPRAIPARSRIPSLRPQQLLHASSSGHWLGYSIRAIAGAVSIVILGSSGVLSPDATERLLWGVILGQSIAPILATMVEAVFKRKPPAE